MSKSKLTDAQLVLLSAAAQHPERAIEPPPDHKGGAAKKTVGTLLRDGLIEEIPARGVLPIWRRDEDAGPLALRITATGLAAIGVEPSVAEHKVEKQHPEVQDDLAPKRPSRSLAAANRKKSKGHSTDCLPVRSATPTARPRFRTNRYREPAPSWCANGTELPTTSQ